jgi:hypothetical protein
MNACIPVKGNCKEFLYVSTDKYSIAQIAVNSAFTICAMLYLEKRGIFLVTAL